MYSKTIQRETEKRMHIVLFVLLEAYECKVLKITVRLSSKKRESKASYLKKTENVFCK